MDKIKLGSQGLEVSQLGLGCMGMSWAYGQPDDNESARVLDRALELGINFWDTAEIYGPFKNEELLGRAIKRHSRDKIVIATKFAWTFSASGERADLDSSPTHIKKTIEGSLKRLQTDYIDLYYQHRLDPKTPIEDTVHALGELVKAGKIRSIGLSEVDAATVRRAHRVHPVTAIQSEYSLWERSVEIEILPTLRELNIGFVPYSPMGRGLLTGTIAKAEDLAANDSRRNHPRFAQANLEKNLSLVNEITRIANAHGATPTQLALKWLMRQGPQIVPIPGTKRVRYLEENALSPSLNLPESAWQQIAKALETFKPSGTRYPESQMHLVPQ